jgi:hypothetical protein
MADQKGNVVRMVGQTSGVDTFVNAGRARRSPAVPQQHFDFRRGRPIAA